MPLNVVNVTTTATLLGNFAKGSVSIYNYGLSGGAQPSGGATVFLGPNSSVTTSNGLPFPVGSRVLLTNLGVNAPAVYAITAAGTTALSVEWVGSN